MDRRGWEVAGSLQEARVRWCCGESWRGGSSGAVGMPAVVHQRERVREVRKFVTATLDG